MTNDEELSNAIRRLTQDVERIERSLGEVRKEAKESIQELRASLQELRSEQRDTRDLFQRGRGALFVLSILGVLFGVLMTWGKDVLRPWFGH
jgi:signal transduction histidine kinase